VASTSTYRRLARAFGACVAFVEAEIIRENSTTPKLTGLLMSAHAQPRYWTGTK
jgi:hypothetical protein